MKNIVTRTIYMAVIGIGLLSCNLNEYPNNSLLTENSWETLSDVSKFRSGCYSQYRSLYAGKNIIGLDAQSDLMHATIGYDNYLGDLYRWDFASNQFDIGNRWMFAYMLIKDANNIINNIYRIQDKTTEANDLTYLETVKGEAYLFRAMVYHDLVLRFAKDYEPETAAVELGLPLVTDVDVNNKPSRSTLDATYKMIKSDISESRKLLKIVGEQDSKYLTIDVLDAFEARVDLYMHNYPSAYQLAIKNIDKYPLINQLEDYKRMWKEDISSEVLFQTTRYINEYAPAMGAYLSYNEAKKAYDPQYIPTQNFIDLFDSEDIRMKGGFMMTSIMSNNIKADHILLVNKYPGNDILAHRPHEYNNMIKSFRIAEQYLIASEAAYLENNYLESLKWLNKLRIARGATELTVTDEALFKAIQTEWSLEFFAEGMRLDQLKRWHLGFSRGVPQNNSVVILDDANLKIEANNIRFVWEIPYIDLSSNTNLVPNW